MNILRTVEDLEQKATNKCYCIKMFIKRYVSNSPFAVLSCSTKSLRISATQDSFISLDLALEIETNYDEMKRNSGICTNNRM